MTPRNQKEHEISFLALAAWVWQVWCHKHDHKSSILLGHSSLSTKMMITTSQMTFGGKKDSRWVKLIHCFYSNRSKASHFDSTIPLFSSRVPEKHLAWTEKTYCMKNIHLSPVWKLRWMVTTSGSSLLIQNMRQNSVASSEPEVGFMCLDTYFKWLITLCFAQENSVSGTSSFPTPSMCSWLQLPCFH